MTRAPWLERLWGEAPAPSPGLAVAGRLLSPLSWVYGAGARLHLVARQRGLLPVDRAPLPIVSVGGLEVGGVGKTPMALELYRAAREAGFHPAILSRGYGGAMPADARRVPDDAAEGRDDGLVFGDEPVWLARETAGTGGAGVWVSRRRLGAAVAAASSGADLGILDDGLQHLRLHRDGDVLCLSGPAPWANGRLLPRGPLRERPQDALRRSALIVLSTVPPEEAGRVREQVRSRAPAGARILSWHGRYSIRAGAGDPPAPGETVELLAAIAHPERLLGVVRGLGLQVAAVHFHRDHHRFRASDIPRRREGHNCPILTTEKDWVRLEPLLAQLAGRRLAVIRQQLVWNEPEARSALRDFVRRAAAESDGSS